MRVAALKCLRELYMSRMEVSYSLCTGEGINFLMDFLTSKNDDCKIHYFIYLGVIEGLCALDDLCIFIFFIF